MRFLCKFGVHDWRRRETARPGTSVYRCRRCDRRLVYHSDRRRKPKRYFAVAILATSIALWFVIINLGLTGHTKVVKTTKAVVVRVDRAGSRARAAIHRAQGDEGPYVDPAPKR